MIISTDGRYTCMLFYPLRNSLRNMIRVQKWVWQQCRHLLDCTGYLKTSLKAFKIVHNYIVISINLPSICERYRRAFEADVAENNISHISFLECKHRTASVMPTNRKHSAQIRILFITKYVRDDWWTMDGYPSWDGYRMMGRGSADPMRILAVWDLGWRRSERVK